MTDEPMMFEVKVTDSTTATLATTCPVYTIKAGGLYVIAMPADATTEQFLAAKRAAFAPGSEVLDPPATFLFIRMGWTFTEQTDEDLSANIAAMQAILTERHAAGKDTHNGEE